MGWSFAAAPAAPSCCAGAAVWAGTGADAASAGAIGELETGASGPRSTAGAGAAAGSIMGGHRGRSEARRNFLRWDIRRSIVKAGSGTDTGSGTGGSAGYIECALGVVRAVRRRDELPSICPPAPVGHVVA